VRDIEDWSVGRKERRCPPPPSLVVWRESEMAEAGGFIGNGMNCLGSLILFLSRVWVFLGEIVCYFSCCFFAFF
jgi:hypothetical protein